MIYGSVCSGIEAASAAWHPLGWRPAFFSEVEAFPNAVLAHHYPEVPNLGDFTAIGADRAGIDLLVGGTPCQDFSIAGLRAGLDGDRGALTIEFIHLLARLRPRWFVWENVPGVLSADDGRAFGAFLGLLGQCGYGFAYRILDAQFFGVPQRRRRVFVVGCLGDWRAAAAVLFERYCLEGHPEPKRTSGQTAPTLFASGAGTERTASSGSESEFLVAGAIGQRISRSHTELDGHGAYVTHSLRAEGFDASEDGTGRGTPIIAFKIRTGSPEETGEYGGTPGKSAGKGYLGDDTTAFTVASVQDQFLAIGVSTEQEPKWSEDLSPTLKVPSKSGDGQPTAVVIRAGGDYADPTISIDDKAFLAANPMSDRQMAVYDGRIASAVRRLTPRECERLQGFPDDYTLVPYRNKPAADGPRYRALGNSMAVPVMRWIGQRIDMVQALM